MDFKITLDKIIRRFFSEDVQYAFIGGFAMAMWGIPRTTIDLDILVNKKDLGKIDAILKEYGFTCVFSSEDVAQYISSLAIFGEIDFLLAYREFSLKMLNNAIEKPVFGGEMSIKVLRLEDIIGLKIQAASNNKERSTREYLDIEDILTYYGKTLDWERLREYFSLFNEENKYNYYKERYIR